MKFGHVAISVANLQRSVSFYRRVFGLVCKEKYGHPALGMVIALLKKGDIALELFEFKKRVPLPRYRKKLKSDLHTLGVKHFSIEVDAIERFYKKLKKSRVGIEIPLSVFDSGARYFFIKDPDGILVEVMEVQKP